MAYAIVNTDRLGDEIVSVQYYVGTAKTAVQNGSIVVLGALETGSREVHKATAVADVDGTASTVANGALYLIASPEYMYEAGKLLNEFINPTTEPARAYKLEYGKYFSVTKEAFYNSVAPTTTNKYITLYSDASPLMTAVSSASNNKIGELVDIWTSGGETFYGIRVCA